MSYTSNSNNCNGTKWFVDNYDGTWTPYNTAAIVEDGEKSLMASKSTHDAADKPSRDDEDRACESVTKCQGAVVVAEHLIAELVSGRVGSSLPLSESQLALNVDRSIAYLATLCFAEQDTVPYGGGDAAASARPTTPSVRISPRLRQRFRDLQKICNDASTGQENSCRRAPATFELSPRLCPSQEQLDVVRRDVKRVEKELAIKAQMAADALMNKEVEDDGNCQKEKQVRTKRKRRVPKLKKVILNEEAESDSVRGKKEDTETLEDLLRQRFASKDIESGSNDDRVDSPWVEVTKSKRNGSSTPAGASTDVPQATCTLEEHNNAVCSNLHELTISRVPSEEVDAQKGCLGERAYGEMSEPQVFDKAGRADDEELGTLPALVPATDHPNDAAPTEQGPSTPLNPSPMVSRSLQQRQEKRIRDLEMALANMQKDHETSLQKERQGYEDLIQSLQLRLYISETRLKAYEEALQAHIQAVATNVCGGGQPSSPNRTRVDPSLTEDAASPRSLIAKALQKNNEQNGTKTDSMSGDGKGHSRALLCHGV